MDLKLPLISLKSFLEGFSSSLYGINTGITQGSVWGTFLFLVYINDIVKDINNDILICSGRI